MTETKELIAEARRLHADWIDACKCIYPNLLCDALEASEARAAAAEADNAALLEAACNLGELALCGCDGEVGMECQRCVERRVVSLDHPGATLLAEHEADKALIERLHVVLQLVRHELGEEQQHAINLIDDELRELGIEAEDD